MWGPGDSEEPSDEDLARAAQAGDAAAFVALAARQRPFLLAYLRRLVRDPSYAEDLAQATLDVAYDQRAALRQPEAVAGWLRRIALNHLRQDWRRRRRLVPLDPSRPLSGDIAPDLTRPLSEELEAVLSAEVRAVVRLRADGYGVGEIARRLGVSPSTVKRRLREARERVRILLEEGDMP